MTVICFDMLNQLIDFGLESVAHQILEQCSANDLKCCEMVSRRWRLLLQRFYQHHEHGRVGGAWRRAEPRISRLQCDRQRAICTITSMAVDESSVVCALGSSGTVVLWDRIRCFAGTDQDDVSGAKSPQWSVDAHLEGGVYCVAMNQRMVASGGEDGCVRLWQRCSGHLLHSLTHHLTGVWSLKLLHDQLFTFAHDCSVALITFHPDSQQPWPGVFHFTQIDGPVEWYNALGTDSQVRMLVTLDEESFDLRVWDVQDIFNQQKSLNQALQQGCFSLKGHEDEVLCVAFLLPLVASGGADKTVRLWKLQPSSSLSGYSQGQCIRILRGHEGKIWCIDLDSQRLVSGGRYGEIKVWDIGGQHEDAEDDLGRSFWSHPRFTAVGQIHVERTMMISADGLGIINFFDFWSARPALCACKNS